MSGLDLSNCSTEAKGQFEQELSMLADGQRLANESFYSSLFNSGNLLDYLPDNANYDRGREFPNKRRDRIPYRTG